MKSLQDFGSPQQFREYLRAYYAGLALQGILSASTTCENGYYNPDHDTICKEAVRMADELLKQLEAK